MTVNVTASPLMPSQPAEQVAEKWAVTWYAPDGDHRKVRSSEEAARELAASDDVAPWNPIIEHIVTTTSTRVIFNAATDREPQPEDGPDYHADHAAWRTRNSR